MMSTQDETTTVAELKGLMDAFVAARDWRQFHDPKNLSASIAIEAAELMEHFQWVHSDALAAISEDPDQMAEIEEEVADILAYLVSFATTMKIDLAHALRAKMVKNEAKYPVDRYYGSFKPKL
jgi:dCTP diphosphatase